MKPLANAFVTLIALASSVVCAAETKVARYPNAFIDADAVTLHALPPDFFDSLILSTENDRTTGMGIDAVKLKKVSTKSAKLSKKQIASLLDAIYYSEEFHPAKDCYHPHHVFVFSNKSGEFTGAIEVCLSCSATRQFPGHSTGGYSVNNIDFSAIGAIIAELKLPLTPYKSRAEMEKITQHSAMAGLEYRNELNDDYNGFAEKELKIFKSIQQKEIAGDRSSDSGSPKSKEESFPDKHE